MIPKIELKSKEDIEQFQLQKLKEQLHYVNSFSPFYRNLFKSHSIAINSIQQLSDLTKIPVTTKDDLQQNNAAFFSASTSEIIDFASTSGTTGNPITFGLTDSDLERLAYNEAISFACAGINAKNKVQLMTTMDRQFMAGLAYFLGLRKLGATVIRTGAGIPALQWNSILLNKPDYLIVVPSFLIKMIEYAEKNNINLKKTSVKAAICIGDSLRMQDFSPTELTKRIQAKWPIQLFSTYASTEMSTAFTECTERRGGHLHPELIIAEVLDESNKPVKKGSVGELTITTLGVKGTPLIRYKTGDLLRMEHKNCPCGRNTPRVSPVLGRSKQMIKYKGTTLFPPAIHNVLNEFKEIENHIILLQTNTIGTDDVVVKICGRQFSTAFLHELKEKFKAKIRVIPAIEIIDNSTLQQLKTEGNSRKPKWIIDNRRK